MLFLAEYDAGDRIGGYFVPDTFSGQGTIAVTRGGEELLRFQTDEPRPAIAAAGRHETGLCGFTIDEARLPGLSQMTELEIREVESDILIYRRCDPASVVPRKVFRMETHILPLNRLDRALQPHFQFYFPSVDRFGLESIHQTFLMINSNSVFGSGRVMYKSVEQYLDGGYDAIAVLHDPFEELAERLLVLRLIGKGNDTFLAMRDKIALSSAIDFAVQLDLRSEKDLKRAFRRMEPAVANAFADPLVRLLTARLPDEPVTMSSVTNALSTLASFSVVGLRSRADLFGEAVATLLGLDGQELPKIDRPDAVVELGRLLRDCPPIERLLEYDLVLHHYLADAFEKSLSEA